MLIFIKLKFDYKFKYITQAIYNKKNLLPKQKIIIKMMKHINQIFVMFP
jgi:hypothetical protein